MSRELDLIARQFSKKPVTILRKNLNLYGKSFEKEMRLFAKDTESIAKREKKGNLVLLSILSD